MYVSDHQGIALPYNVRSLVLDVKALLEKASSFLNPVSAQLAVVFDLAEAARSDEEFEQCFRILTDSQQQRNFTPSSVITLLEQRNTAKSSRESSGGLRNFARGLTKSEPTSLKAIFGLRAWLGPNTNDQFDLLFATLCNSLYKVGEVLTPESFLMTLCKMKGISIATGTAIQATNVEVSEEQIAAQYANLLQMPIDVFKSLATLVKVLTN